MALNNILEPNNYNLYDNSLTFNPNTTNPKGADPQGHNTLWTNSGVSNHLFYGQVDLSAGGGAVTQLNAGQGITLAPNPITTTGTISGNLSTGNGIGITPGITGDLVVGLLDTIVTPGSYKLGNFTVDQQGRLTHAENGNTTNNQIFIPAINSIYGNNSIDNFWTSPIPVGGFIPVLRYTSPSNSNPGQAILNISVPASITALKGFKLTSFDVIHHNTNALVTSIAFADVFTFTNNSPISITALAVTGSFTNTISAGANDVYVDNFTINTPTFLAQNQTIVIFIEVQSAIGNIMDLYGVNLYYDEVY